MTRAVPALALAVSALVACGRSEPRGTGTAPTPPARDDAATIAPPRAAVLPVTTTRLVTAIVADWSATTAELRLWERDGKAWRAAGPAWPGVIGRTGAAWGIGLHGDGAPAGRAGPVKREGDGKSPAGVFALTGTFGYAASPPEGAALPYTQVDARWRCVDDPASRHYNRVLDERTTTVDWTSAEDMRRADPLYTWVVEIAHNPARTGGDGSCIFLHVWGGPDAPTVGCTAMAEPALAGLLTRLAPGDTSAFVLLPRAEYDALATVWSLPAAR